MPHKHSKKILSHHKYSKKCIKIVQLNYFNFYNCGINFKLYWIKLIKQENCKASPTGFYFNLKNRLFSCVFFSYFSRFGCYVQIYQVNFSVVTINSYPLVLILLRSVNIKIRFLYFTDYYIYKNIFSVYNLKI